MRCMAIQHKSQKFISSFALSPRTRSATLAISVQPSESQRIGVPMTMRCCVTMRVSCSWRSVNLRSGGLHRRLHCHRFRCLRWWLLAGLLIVPIRRLLIGELLRLRWLPHAGIEPGQVVLCLFLEALQFLIIIIAALGEDCSLTYPDLLLERR